MRLRPTSFGWVKFLAMSWYGPPLVIALLAVHPPEGWRTRREGAASAEAARKTVERAANIVNEGNNREPKGRQKRDKAA